MFLGLIGLRALLGLTGSRVGMRDVAVGEGEEARAPEPDGGAIQNAITAAGGSGRRPAVGA